MKQKRFFTLLILLIVLVLTLGLTACNKEKEQPYITGIDVHDCPQKYYAEGESFTLENGSIDVMYSNGTTKNILMTDENVVVTKPGTNIPNKTNVCTLHYNGFKTSFYYYVSPKNKVVKSVEFIEGEDKPEYYYAKSELRRYAPDSELNGVKVLVKYRIGENGKPFDDKEFVLGEVPFSSYGIECNGFDTKTLGKKTMVYRYLADTFSVDYEVVNYDWIESVKLIGTPAPYYFVGDAFYSGGAYYEITYNSLKKEKRNLDDKIITGFDTTTCKNDKTYTVSIYDGKKLFESYNFKYSVFAKNDKDIVDRVELKNNKHSVINVNDKLTFSDFLKGTELSVILKDGGKVVNLNGGDSSVVISFSKDDGNTYNILTEQAFNEIKKKGQEVKLKISYLSATDDKLSYTSSSYYLTVVKHWVKTEVTNWQDKYEVVKDGEFSFGDAKIKRIYDDGTFDEYLLQDIYKMSIADRTKIKFDINLTQTASDADKFDTSKVGTFEKKYYIDIGYDDGVFINGNKTDIKGRLYINYQVK